MEVKGAGIRQGSKCRRVAVLTNGRCAARREEGYLISSPYLRTTYQHPDARSMYIGILTNAKSISHLPGQQTYQYFCVDTDFENEKPTPTRHTSFVAHPLIHRSVVWSMSPELYHRIWLHPV
jgi:hypothetical protein